MGRLIYCIGEKAKSPYYFASTGTRVYTMEELCYYLYHSVETLAEDLSEEQLISWIRDELKMEERADFLEQLKHRDAGIKDLAVAVFCSTDYYSQEEIESLLAEIDAYFALLPIARKKRHADAFLRYGNTREAMLEYRSLIDDREFSRLADEEQGQAYHNLAVLLARDGMFRNASRYFLQAYEKSGEKESLCQYLYALRLGGMEAEFNHELNRFFQETDVMRRMENQFYFIEENREYSPEYGNVLRLMELKDKEELEEDFWWLLDETIHRLKKAYRS